MNIEDWYLDLDKVSSLKTEDERRNIHDYYRDMLSLQTDGRVKQSKSIMNTLFKAGYLKNVTQEERTEKIETILG